MTRKFRNRSGTKKTECALVTPQLLGLGVKNCRVLKGLGWVRTLRD